MIPKLELLTKQKIHKIPLSTLEKDYILGLVLASLYRHSSIQEQWVFKGGTCLKKAYFSDYRMSEDLDFTLKPEASVNPKDIEDTLMEVFEIGSRDFGLKIERNSLQINPFPDKNGLFIQIKVPFQGPLMSTGSLPRIKLDLSKDEILLDTPSKRSLLHNYSDSEIVKTDISCYSMDELFAEKCRALVQRTRPRDLYDVIHIYERVYEGKGFTESFMSLIREKFKFKDLIFPLHLKDVFKDQLEEAKESWLYMLEHQIQPLEDIDSYIKRLDRVFLDLGVMKSL